MSQLTSKTLFNNYFAFLQIREKKTFIENIPYLIEAIFLMEANYKSDLYDEFVIHSLYFVLNEWNMKLQELTIFQDGIPDQIQRPIAITFNDFSEEYCLSHFRFRK